MMPLVAFDLQGMGTYLAIAAGLVVGAIVVAVRQRRSLRLFQPGYGRFLVTRWRLAAGALAIFCLAVIAPYTGDPTWDYADSILMGVLTYLTAPWVLGCFVLAARRQITPAELYVALVAWMVSASWSYDVYILLRDRVYPPSALSNILASSVLYFAGGLFFSLDWRPGRGVTFAFLEPDWPTGGARGAFPRLIAYAIAIAALVTVSLGWVFLLR